MTETQLIYNQSTKHNWECFAEHRDRMMRLIRQAQKGAGARIAVLGGRQLQRPRPEGADIELSRSPPF